MAGGLPAPTKARYGQCAGCSRVFLWRTTRRDWQKRTHLAAGCNDPLCPAYNEALQRILASTYLRARSEKRFGTPRWRSKPPGD